MTQNLLYRYLIIDLVCQEKRFPFTEKNYKFDVSLLDK